MKKTLKYILPVVMLGIAAFAFTTPTENSEAQQADNEAEINWMTIEEAYEANKKEPRKTFVDVYTNWCGWCKKMDRDTFSNAEVAKYVNENYYAVKLNAESPEKHQLGESEMSEAGIAQSFRVRSFPTIVFIEEDFKTIQAVPGYRDAKGFMEVLKAFKNTEKEAAESDSE